VRDRLTRLRGRWHWFDVTMATHERFGELEGGMVAAGVTLNLFVSLFPALLAGTAVIGYVAVGHVDLAGSIIDRLGLTGSTADMVRDAVTAARHSRQAASIVGFAGLAWSAIGIVVAIQRAIDKAWQVKAGGLRRRGIAALWLLAIGALLTAAIATTTLVVGVLPPWAAPLAIVPTVAVNIAVVWVTFAMLGTRKVGWRALLPGAVVAGVGLQVLTTAGPYVLARTVANSSALYGSLGTVFAVLAWLFLFGRLLVYASILNVVLYEHDRGTVTVEIEAPRMPGEVPVAANRGGVVSHAVP